LGKWSLCAVCGTPFQTLSTRAPYCCSLRCRVAISVDKRGDDECWPWLGLLDQDGYGEFGFKKKKYKSHRAVLELKDGPIPRGIVAMHSCDNRPCCNPAHISGGTAEDNNNDRIAKGRSVGAKGERAGHAKLTEAQIRAIRSDPRPGPQVARDYPVNEQAIYKIRRGERWGHVQ
jgi:hypothetical protein